MSVKKLFPWLLVVVLIVATAAGCKESEPTAIELVPIELVPIELVPQDANLIANIQVSKIINDQDLRDAYDKAKKEPGQPQTAEEALDELITETGIDLRDFSQAVIFADITTLDQAGYIAVIVEGTVNEKQFIYNIEQQMGEEFSTSKYKGYKLYTDEEEEFGIAFLSDSIFLLGTPKAVKDAIDVSKGVREQVSGILLDTYNRLDDALIKLALEFPEEARSALTEEPTLDEIPISLEPFADIDILGFALNKEAEAITIQINSHFLSLDSAEDAKNTLSGAISLFKGILQVPEIKELLGKIEVSITDSWLTIAFEITLAEMEELTETFQP